MMAMVDNVTGMVYWVPTDQSPMPPFAPVVMPYRFLRPVTPVMAPQPAAPVVNTTVFVRGVPREATTQTVETHFKIYGDILSCHVIRHKDASTNKGIAFVKFHDFAAAQRAIDCNNPGVMEHREIFAEWAHPKPATSGTRAVPDQSIAGEYIPRPNAPHLYLTSPASHLMNSPSFFPAPSPVMPAITFTNAHLPWIITPGASSSMAPYGSYNLPGSHVLGFPHPGFSGGAVVQGNVRENLYGQEISLARPPNYFPVMDYNPGGVNAPAVSRSFGHHSEDQKDGKSGESSDEDSRNQSTSESRKGKEGLNDS